MNSTSLTVVRGEPRVGTWILSKGFEVEHRALRRLIMKYQLEFEEFGVIATAMQKPNHKGGRPIDEFLLNEEQVMYIGTLLTNNEVVRIFKRKIVKEFYRMKQELIRIASQNQNAEWLETRKVGKVTRSISTDTIKVFIDYATKQGSKKANMYYQNITKMENKALFLLDQKYPNLRDVLDIHQLSTVKSADMIIMKALTDGMDRNMNYSEIYHLAKTRVESFAEIIGKTMITKAMAIT